MYIRIIVLNKSNRISENQKNYGTTEQWTPQSLYCYYYYCIRESHEIEVYAEILACFQRPVYG